MAKNTKQVQNEQDDNGLQDTDASASVPLVEMRKDGQTLEVHPSTVDAHRRAGWVEV